MSGCLKAGKNRTYGSEIQSGSTEPLKMKSGEAETIELAESCISDGIRLGSRGLCDDAIEALDQAVLACQASDVDSDSVRRLTAQAVANKGAALGDLDRHAEAVECYNAAITIYQKLCRRFAGQDERAGLLSDYAFTIMAWESQCVRICRVVQNQARFEPELRAAVESASDLWRAAE